MEDAKQQQQQQQHQQQQQQQHNWLHSIESNKDLMDLIMNLEIGTLVLNIHNSTYDSLMRGVK